MSTHENAPPLDGWQPPPPKCCGQLCLVRDCPVCGITLPMPLDGRGEN